MILPDIPVRIVYPLENNDSVRFNFVVTDLRPNELKGRFPNPVDGEIFREGDSVWVDMKYKFSKNSPVNRYEGKKVGLSITGVYGDGEGVLRGLRVRRALVGRERELWGDSRSDLLVGIVNDRDSMKIRESQAN